MINPPKILEKVANITIITFFAFMGCIVGGILAGCISKLFNFPILIVFGLGSAFGTIGAFSFGYLSWKFSKD